MCWLKKMAGVPCAWRIFCSGAQASWQRRRSHTLQGSHDTRKACAVQRITTKKARTRCQIGWSFSHTRRDTELITFWKLARLQSVVNRSWRTFTIENEHLSLSSFFKKFNIPELHKYENRIMRRNLDENVSKNSCCCGDKMEATCWLSIFFFIANVYECAWNLMY